MIGQSRTAYEKSETSRLTALGGPSLTHARKKIFRGQEIFLGRLLTSLG